MHGLGLVRFGCSGAGAGTFGTLVLGLCDLCVCMCCQMSFASAICHKHNVMEIGVTAAGEGRRPLLAVIYDELVRYAGLRLAQGTICVT